MCACARKHQRRFRLLSYRHIVVVVIVVAVAVVAAVVMSYSQPSSAAARSLIARKPVPEDPLQPFASPPFDADWMPNAQPPRPKSRKEVEPSFYPYQRLQQPAGPRHMKSISEYKDYYYDTGSTSTTMNNNPRNNDSGSSRMGAYRLPHPSPSPSRLSMQSRLEPSSASFTDNSDEEEDDDDFPPPPPPPAHRSTLSLATPTTMPTPSPYSSSIHPPIALPPPTSTPISTQSTIAPDDADSGTVRRPRPQSRLDLDSPQSRSTQYFNRGRTSPSPSRPMLHQDWKTKMEEQYEWKNPPSVFLKNQPQRAQTFHAFAQNNKGRPSTAQAAYNPQSFFLARSESSPLSAFNGPDIDSTFAPSPSPGPGPAGSGSTSNRGLGTFVPVTTPSDLETSSVSSISSVLPTIPPGPGPSRGRPQSRAQSRLGGATTPRPVSPRKHLARSNLSMYSSSPPKTPAPIEQPSNDFRPSTRSGTALSSRAGSALSYATTRRSLYSSSSPLLPTPSLEAERPKTSALRDKPKKKTVTEPIIESDGTVTDPSDYLPPDTWAPEPDHMEDELAAKTPSEDKENYEGRTGRTSVAAKTMPARYDTRASSRLSRSMSPTKTRRRPLARPPSAVSSLWADNQDYHPYRPSNTDYSTSNMSSSIGGSNSIDRPLSRSTRQDSYIDLDFHNTLSPAKTRASPVPPPRSRSPTRPQTTRSGINLDFYAPPTGPPLPKSVPIQPGLGCEASNGSSSGTALPLPPPPPPSSSSPTPSSAFAPLGKAEMYGQYDYYPARPASTMRSSNSRPMTAAAPMDALSYGMRRMELSDVGGRG